MGLQGQSEELGIARKDLCSTTEKVQRLPFKVCDMSTEVGAAVAEPNNSLEQSPWRPLVTAHEVCKEPRLSVVVRSRGPTLMSSGPNSDAFPVCP